MVSARWARVAVLTTLLLIAITVFAGCGADKSPRAPSVTIGFLYVGETNDFGYNQAAHDGSLAVQKAFPNATLIQRRNVPESPAAEPVMQEMIDRGATIIFPTSFGHLESALNVAARNPNVTFLHQGGLENAANLGTYFGTIWEPQFLAGITAGLTTRSHRLGLVAAFPIAQSLLTINAFELGARSVNPRARTRVIFTGAWCDPAKQRAAATQLLGWSADVLAQHQDCTRAVIETAAKAGAKVTGYHQDAMSIAPKSWLTGSVWNWGPLYVDMVRTILAGKFAQSAYASRFRGGLRNNVVKLAPFGPTVARAVRDRVLSAQKRMLDGSLRPFDGPIRDQAGHVRITGRQPDVTQLEETDYLVEGVVGQVGAG